MPAPLLRYLGGCREKHVHTRTRAHTRTHVGVRTHSKFGSSTIGAQARKHKLTSTSSQAQARTGTQAQAHKHKHAQARTSTSTHRHALSITRPCLRPKHRTKAQARKHKLTSTSTHRHAPHDHKDRHAPHARTSRDHKDRHAPHACPTTIKNKKKRESRDSCNICTHVSCMLSRNFRHITKHWCNVLRTLCIDVCSYIIYSMHIHVS